MKSILQVRQNIYYKKETADSKDLTKIHEIVLLLDNPTYKRTNEGDVIRERGIEEVRFAVTDKGLDVVIETLQQYKNSKEEDLY